MNKIKRILKTTILLAAVCLMCGLSVNASAADQLTYPDRAVRSGNNVYYALGNDGVGYIYRYNVSTGKKSLFVKKPCYYNGMFISGKYLYFTVDNYGGSDGRDRYIYRIGLNGKGLKRLASGYSPVVIGNKVYYTGVSKVKEYRVIHDSALTGIWQMSLTGSNKKCIYKGNAMLLAKSGENLLVGWKTHFTISTSGKKIADFQYGSSVFANTFWGSRYSRSEAVTVCSNSQGYQYSSSGSVLYRTVNGKTTKIRTFKNQTVYKIIDLNGYLWVVTQEGYSRANVYIMKANGKSCKKLTTFQMAGGSW